jgi:hypothetical protein
MPSASASLSPSPPAVATMSSGMLAYGGDDVVHPAGTYVANDFRYPFTAVIDSDLGIRDSGQFESFVYIGQDKNAPVNGDEEFDAMFLTRVLDPTDQRSLHDLSGDALEWLLKHPRLEVVDGSRVTLNVDGLAARQADFLPSEPVPCGNFHRNLLCVLIGFGPPGDEPFALFDGSRLRVVVVEHPGRQIVFAYQSATGAYAGKVTVFDRWVRSADFR